MLILLGYFRANPGYVFRFISVLILTSSHHETQIKNFLTNPLED